MSEGEKELPQGWVEGVFSDICVLRNGFAVKSKFYTEEGFPVLRQSNLTGHIVDMSNCKFVSNETAEPLENYYVGKGDIIIGLSGSIGEPSKYLETYPSIQNQRTGLLQSKIGEVGKQFSALFLEHAHSRLMSNAKGMAVQNISSKDIHEFELNIPPLAEQSRIVDKIDELFSSIEAGERAIARARTALTRYRKAVLKAAVTGELTADWRAKNPPTETAEALLKRILKARYAAWEKTELEKLDAKGKARPKTEKEWVKFRARYKAPVEADTEGLPDLPEGWVWASLAGLCEIKGGVTVNRKREAENPVEIPYLRVANVQAGHIDLTTVKNIIVDAKKAKEKYLQTGDILMNEGGDLDKLGRGWVWYGQIHPCIHQNHVFRARPYIAELSVD